MKSEFVPIQKTDTLDSIVAAIKNYIIKNNLKDGIEILGEREMAEQMGVSRKSIREALRVAQTLGLITIRQGKRPVVAENSGNAVSLALTLMLHRSKRDIMELIYVRQGLETQLARLAAERITDEQINELETTVGDMEKNPKNIEICVNADLRFHEIILEASSSLVFEIILSPLNDFIKKTRIETLRRTRGRAVSGHRNIITALKARDPVKASAAMFEHLEQAIEDINPNLEDK